MVCCSILPTHNSVVGLLLAHDELEQMCKHCTCQHSPKQTCCLLTACECADGTEEYDSEGSDSDEDEDIEGVPGSMLEEDSDDDEESDDSDEADGFAHRSSVIIEEVHDVDQDGIHVISATAAQVPAVLTAL